MSSWSFNIAPHWKQNRTFIGLLIKNRRNWPCRCWKVSQFQTGFILDGSTHKIWFQGKELHSFDQLGRPKSIHICRSGFDYDDQMDWHGLVSISEDQAKERGRADVYRNFYAQVRLTFLNIFGVFEKIKTNKENTYIQIFTGSSKYNQQAAACSLVSLWSNSFSFAFLFSFCLTVCWVYYCFHRFLIRWYRISKCLSRFPTEYSAISKWNSTHWHIRNKSLHRSAKFTISSPNY